MASVKFREEGNLLFKTAFAEGLCPAVQSLRLEKASNSYHRAFNAQENRDEKASAAKNLAICEWKLGVLAFKRFTVFEQQLHHFKEALRYFLEAKTSGQLVKSKDWNSNIATKYAECCHEVSDHLQQVGMLERIQGLTQILPFIDTDDLLADIYLEIATHHFHVGINALQKGNFHECKYHMDECHFPIHEAYRYGSTRESIFAELSVLQEDTRMHRCMAESSHALHTGDNLLHKITKELESLNMDMVWEVIDWYKQSILLTRELDMEREAIGLSRLGSVYAKVLKMKSQAKEYYRKSILLAESMHPRTFNTCDWYKESAETLKKYQEETVMFEEEQREKERAKVKEELVKEFQDLKEKHLKSSNIVFLQYVYKTFPPKNPEHTLDLEGYPDNVDEKKLLQKAVIHYHPDRANQETHGLKWKVLTEEITKYLSSRYENQKHVS